MLPSGAWGKRKPRGRRLGWVRSDARGAMWARQEGLHHPHPHTVVRCPSSSSSVSCSGKGRPGCPGSLGPLGLLPLLLSSQPPRSTHFLLPTATAAGFQSREQPGAVSLGLCLSVVGAKTVKAGFPHSAQPPLFLSARACLSPSVLHLRHPHSCPHVLLGHQ